MKKGLTMALLLLVAAAAATAYQQGGLLDGIVPGPDGRIDVVTVFPHQDDESLFSGGKQRPGHVRRSAPRGFHRQGGDK